MIHRVHLDTSNYIEIPVRPGGGSSQSSPQQIQNQPQPTPPSEAEKLNSLVTKSNRILFQTSNTFPFDFFPDEIIIDENKINVIVRNFFSSEIVHSIPLPDLHSVMIERSPFFSALKITATGFRDEPLTMTFLRNDDAIRAKRIIQGLIEVRNQHIDLSKIDPKTAAKRLEEIGKSKAINI